MNARTLISLLVLTIVVVIGYVYFKGGKDASRRQHAGRRRHRPAALDTPAPRRNDRPTDRRSRGRSPTPLTALAGKTIKVATEGAYPPFNFVDANGELQGFDVDIAKALCAKMQADCEIVEQDWDGMIPGLLAKKYDAIIASMSITEERKQKIDFTGKYYNTPAVIVAAPIRQSRWAPTAIRIRPASKGLKIGVQRATIHENFVRDNFTDVGDRRL